MAIHNPVTIIDDISNRSIFTPTNYSGLLAVKTEAGSATYTEAMATGATKVHLSCTSEDGTAGNTTGLWVAFAATAADAASVVNATAGSEAGMILTNNIVAGWVIDTPIGIPVNARDGGFMAFAITGADGTDFSTLNVTQGV